MSRTVNKSDAYYVSIEIKLIGGKAMYRRKEVVLPQKVFSKLKGKGEGSEITIYKRNLEYKKDE